MTEDEKHNESVKLFANWLNGLAITFFAVAGIGFILNLFLSGVAAEFDGRVILTIGVAILGSFLMHSLGHMVLLRWLK